MHETGIAKVGVLGMAALMVLTLTAPAIAQQSAGKENPRATAAASGKKAARFAPTPWQVRCVATGGKGGGTRCVLGRSIVELRSKQTLLAINISNDRKQMTLMMPHGVDLRKPAQLLVDGRSVGKIAFITSRPQGLIAQLALTPAMLEAMRKGKALAVRMLLPSGKPLRISTDLNGFAAALKKLR